ncbi:MAG TPA: HAD family hydrolase [Acidimicrobiales bacterium]|jgi:HAD superfamily hydrolase (TIGR01509 family)|nr:HAD family hydrolase [Acidimicrobiales bacterium]
MTGGRRPGVLFDVDGTLADTNYLHTLAWSRALRDAGEWAPMNAVHRLIGMGGDQLVPTLLGHDSPQATAARPARYKELMSDARVFPGAHDLLWRLHREGVAVVVATSAPGEEVGPLLELLDAEGAIDATTTADDVTSSKPDPEVFLRAMELGSIDPERALAVGDSIWDIKAARAAGIGCLAVETGGFSQHELTESGAVRVYRDVQEVLDQFQTGPLRTLVA